MKNTLLMLILFLNTFSYSQKKQYPKADLKTTIAFLKSKYN